MAGWAWLAGHGWQFPVGIHGTFCHRLRQSVRLPVRQPEGVANMPTVAPIYTGLLAVLYFWLSLRVSLIRMKGPAPDHAAEARLRRAVRAHGNASEYIPLGLIMLLTLELQGAPFWLVHVFGVMLVAGRAGHFISFTLPSARLLTQISMALTYSMFCFSGLFVLYYVFT
jgi:uncharacterized protein